MLQLTCSPFLPKTQSMAVLGCYTPHHSFIVAGAAMPPPLAVSAMRPTCLQRVSALPLDNALACQAACSDVALSALVEERCLGACTASMCSFCTHTLLVLDRTARRPVDECWCSRRARGFEQDFGTYRTG